jgi:hypothetical protein
MFAAVVLVVMMIALLRYFRLFVLLIDYQDRYLI